MMEENRFQVDVALPGAEAYLEAIYVLVTENRQAQAARVADYLGVSKVSVSRALTRLEKLGYLTERAPELRLSPAGWAQAEAVVRRHRLAERWLADRLGLGLVEAHREAERLEHALSERVERALWEDLGRPRTCPHGNPIPGLDDAPVSLAATVALMEAELGQTYVVDRIFEQLEGLEERLEWIQQAGLTPGQCFTVKRRAQPELPLQVVLDEGSAISVPDDVSTRLLVRPQPSAGYSL